MNFGVALIYSLLGILVVFFALVLLMVIIKGMTLISDRMENKKKIAPAVIESAEQAPSANPIHAQGAAGELKLYDTDPRVAAMLMAIVADELQAPINELRFVSIREVKENI